ncbi:MAG TPA: hypothetical protein VK623_05290 [Flavobacterium sp.]|nr:hypothetical protein [Flavobacterium sp.]
MFLIYLMLVFSFHGESLDWKTGYDFDGDGKNDTVSDAFSGGAHCCYLVSVYLTSNDSTIKIPFELDGGYVSGLDLSNPDNFFVKDYNADGLPDLFLHIHQYNGQESRIPRNITKKYKIKTNRIFVSFKNAKTNYWDFNNK